MRRFTTIILCSILTLTISIDAYSKTLTGTAQATAFETKLISQSGNTSEIRFTIQGFSQSTISTPQGNAVLIDVKKAARLLEAGSPDLLKLTTSVIIPDNDAMTVTVVSSHYTDYTNIKIAPSKGNLKRDQDPAAVPFTYGPSYSLDAFYPGKLTDLSSPYILRDFRGQTVNVYPFQYNPITQTLRVYDEISVRVTPAGTSSSTNSFQRTKAPMPNVTYNSIYSSRFINYNQTNYTPTSEIGNMLIISDATMIPTMQSFIEWKNLIGQHTEIVSIDSVGVDPSSIQSFIHDKYMSDGLTFVLFVGDGTQIPPYPSSNGPSDPYYGYILGNDAYAEVIIGRFSANTIQELQTQVDRTISYEKFPDVSGAWYSKAVCIGSDQGPGDDNEYDFEHERNIRSKFLAYTYTDADELYDGSQGVVDNAGDPTPADVITSLNDGRSVITYTGHGSSTSFGTTGFSSWDVASLTNTNQLPFIWSVACVNGDFEFGDCLAEALMRSTNNGEATGAIATFMSTINQSWDPPMDGQDEMVDLLIESYPSNIKHTFGGLSVNGCMHMNDQYGVAGVEMTDTWTCFGDPSLTVRTAAPLPITAVHDPVIDETEIVFPLLCNVDGAIVCMSHHNQIMATTTASAGTATLTSLLGLVVGDTLDITITAYNHIPYYGTVIVTAAGSTSINTLSQNPYQLSVSSLSADGKAQMNFTTSEGSTLSAELMTISGQSVKQIFSSEKFNAGQHSMSFSLDGISSGVYVVRMTGAQQNSTCRFVVARR